MSNNNIDSIIKLKKFFKNLKKDTYFIKMLNIKNSEI